MRDSMIFYRSFFEALTELEPTDKAVLYDAIFSYGLDFKEPKLSGIQATIWKLIKPNIDANIKKYKDGNKGGRPPKNKTTTKPQNNHSITTTKPNVDDDVDVDVNDDVNVNKNDIDKRKLKFANTLKPFIAKYGMEMVTDFYKYWTEPNKSNTKFKQELQKTWSVERRLETWAKNDFGKSSKPKTNEKRFLYTTTNFSGYREELIMTEKEYEANKHKWQGSLKLREVTNE